MTTNEFLAEIGDELLELWSSLAEVMAVAARENPNSIGALSAAIGHLTRATYSIQDAQRMMGEETVEEGQDD